MTHCSEMLFRGILPLDNNYACLCPPFTLLALKVIGIAPTQASAGIKECLNRLRLSLLCTVADSRGCISKTETCLYLDAEDIPDSCRSCRETIYRGADITVLKSRWCPPQGLQVHLAIRMVTVLVEHTCRCTPRSCHQHSLFLKSIPLYPKPSEHIDTSS